LDWVVTQNRELKLTGVVTFDESKKPQLEQVFVSLRMGEKSATALDQCSGDIPSDELTLEESLQMMQGRFIDERSLVSDYLMRDSLLRERFLRGHEVRRRTLESGTVVWEVLDQEPELHAILRKYNRLAILGGPGAGKTTFLQYVALAYARERAGDRKLRRHKIMKERLGAKKWRLPIFMSLSSASTLLTKPVNGRSACIADVIPSTLPPDLQKDPIAVEYFLRQLESGNCAVLLDGLDEVPTEADFLVVVRAIESMASRYNKNQFMLTSRISGWRSGIGADFEIFYVNELTSEQIETFIERWYAAVELNAVTGRLQDESDAVKRAREWKAHKNAEDLKRTLRENPGIRGLATNPMLLSIIALVHRSMATLPRERSKLYAECSKILLEQWDYSRGVKVDDTNLTLAQKEAIMQRLAFAIHQGEIGKKGGGREAPRQEVQNLITEILPRLGSSADPAHLLQRLIERSGLIVERQRDVLSFAHHTFQEYFTAHYLARGEGSSNRLFLANPDLVLSDWWAEVVLLYAGLLSDATDFIRSMYDADSADLFRQRLRVAGLCVGEAVGIRDAVLRHNIIIELLYNRTLGQVKSIKGDLADEIVSYLIWWARRQSWFVNAILMQVKVQGHVGATKDLLVSSLDANRNSITSAAALDALQLLPDFWTDEVVRVVVSLSSDKDIDIRRSAVACLGIIAKSKMTEQIESCLIRAVGDTRSVRETAVSTLESTSRLITDVPSVYTQLDQLLTNADRSIRIAAVRSFPSVAVNPPSELVEHFLKAVIAMHREIPVKPGLARLRGSALDAVTVELVHLLESPDIKVRVSATELLPELHAEALRRHNVVERLISALQSHYEVERDHACSALITELDGPLVNDVFEELWHSCASGVQGANHPKAGSDNNFEARSDTTQKLAYLICHDNSHVQAVATRLLGKLSRPPSDEVITILCHRLRSRDAVGVTAAIHAIGELPEKADTDEVIVRLLELAKRRNVLMRFISWVAHLRRDSDVRQDLRDYRLAAIRALGQVGISHRERIADLLQRNFEIWDPAIRSSSLETLFHLFEKSPSIKIFDLLFTELARQSRIYPLTHYWSEREQFASVPFIDSLTNLCNQLPDDLVANRLLAALAARHVGRKALALLIVRKLDHVASLDLVIGQVCENLEDNESFVRAQALGAAGKLLNESSARSILPRLNQRLLDDDSEVREKAWQLVEKWNLASGNWF
jgi:HEAT repeat protein